MEDIDVYGKEHEDDELETPKDGETDEADDENA